MIPDLDEAVDIVVLSLEPWDHVWRRNQHLVAGILRRRPHTRVLFVEPASDLLHDLLRGVAPRPGRGLRQAPPLVGVGPGRLWLYQPTKLLPRRLARHGDRRRSRTVREVARSVGITRPVLWVNDPYGATVSRTTGWPTLYDITDDWTSAARGTAETRRIAESDADLVDRAAAVTVCSPALERRKSVRRHVVLISNGVDVERYRRPAPRPADLPDGRTAVYLGTLHADRLDVALCEQTARALGGVGTVVLVGPDALDRRDTDRLLRAGVLVLGPRTFDQVPGYLQHADLLLVPHVVDAFTDSLDPLKLYEYQAVGRPVLSTPVAGFRDAPADQVTLSPADSFALDARLMLQDVPPASEPVSGIPTWEGQSALMAGVVSDVRRSASRRR